MKTRSLVDLGFTELNWVQLIRYIFQQKLGNKSKRTEPHTIICFIYRDAVNDLALHFLAKMKIMVVKDIEREDIEFICKGLGCKPIASLDHFTADMLGSAELAEEMHAGSSKIVKVCVNIFWRCRRKLYCYFHLMLLFDGIHYALINKGLNYRV